MIRFLRDIKEMASPSPSRIRPIFMDFRLDGDRDVENESPMRAEIAIICYQLDAIPKCRPWKSGASGAVRVHTLTRFRFVNPD
jgi:hypothetical protein